MIPPRAMTTWDLMIVLAFGEASVLGVHNGYPDPEATRRRVMNVIVVRAHRHLAARSVVLRRPVGSFNARRLAMTIMQRQLCHPSNSGVESRSTNRDKARFRIKTNRVILRRQLWLQPHRSRIALQKVRLRSASGVVWSIRLNTNKIAVCDCCSVSIAGRKLCERKSKHILKHALQNRAAGIVKEHHFCSTVAILVEVERYVKRAITLLAFVCNGCGCVGMYVSESYFV